MDKPESPDSPLVGDGPPEVQDGIDFDTGIITTWERPPWMTVEEFCSLSPEELAKKLGEPRIRAHNIMTNGFFVNLFNWFGQQSASMSQAAFLALGTGTLPSGGVSRTDTALVTEWKRYAIINFVLTPGDPPAGTFSYFSPAADGGVTLTEAGIIDSASGGTLLTHAPFSYVKPSSQDVRFDYLIPRSLS